MDKRFGFRWAEVLRVCVHSFYLMKTETVTKTVKIPLETSNRKNEKVQKSIDQWQSIADRMAQLMPTVDESEWRTQGSGLFHIVQNEFDDNNAHDLKAHDAYQAAYKVAESFGSWKSNNHDQDRPSFGDGNFARYCGCCNSNCVFEENDRGYGVKMGLLNRDSEWFHVGTNREYVVDVLDEIVNGDYSAGSGELHLSEDGSLTLHQSYSQDVDVYEEKNAEYAVGVDVGEKMIYCIAVRDIETGEVVHVEMESGEAFRHNRNAFDEKKDRFQKNGKKRMVDKISGERERYTEQVVHNATRRVVDVATEYVSSVIRTEDMKDYRKTCEDPIHDLPFGMFRKQLLYKATDAGIPVDTVGSYYKSQRCRKCGYTDEDNRSSRDTFHCERCGYEVHGDANAAMNIALEDEKYLDDGRRKESLFCY